MSRMLRFTSLITILIVAAHVLAQEPAHQPDSDGEGAFLALPFFAHHVYLSREGGFALLQRDDGGATGVPATCEIAVADLNSRRITANISLPEPATMLAIGEQYACAVLPTTNRIVAFRLADLTPVGERPLKTQIRRLVDVADVFVEVNDSERWSLPDLGAVDERWRVIGQPLEASRPVGDGWFVDGFARSSDLSRVLRFCGHPSLVQPHVLVIDRGMPPQPKGRRLAPLLFALGGLKASKDQPWAFAVTMPKLDTIPENFATADGSLAASITMPEWIRLQVQDPKGSLFSNQLLAGIKANLPNDFDFEEFQQIQPPIPVAFQGKRCVALLPERLIIFTFSDDAYSRIFQRLQISIGNLPIAVDAQKPTTFEIKLTSESSIKRIVLKQGGLVSQFGSARVTIDPEPVIKSLDNASTFESLWQSRRISPLLSADEWAERLRQQGPIREIEKLAGRALAGIPVSVPYQFEVVAETDRTAEIGGCYIIELPVERFRSMFEQRQAERRARLTFPEVKPNSGEPAGDDKQATIEDRADSKSPEQATASDSQSLVQSEAAGRLEETPPDSDLAAARTDSLEAPPEVAEFEKPVLTSRLVAEIVGNLVISTLLGALFLWGSCRMQQAGLPEDARWQRPSLLFVSLMVIPLALVCAGWESLLIAWGKEAVQAIRVPTFLAVLGACVVAGFARLVAVAVGAGTLLRVPHRDVPEIMLFFGLMAFVPGCLLLGIFFAYTIP